ncbi:ACT domain-containing protein ACR8-like [Arachis ipaensis]|uniref:ACT domain-containing protein ACR8-like n=1 Tax=Arachis ipaensis TaxID=130454 RepID=UPI000A2B6C99|nr:ACT domain-containing protein ACR8-like [Arachis ipaensis]
MHTKRRLHQMMFANRDYERTPILKFTYDSPLVTVQNWAERGYSVVNIQCKDRIKLLFDLVCNLTDMEYVVFHAIITTNGDQAYLEFYIRHKDGTPISSDPSDRSYNSFYPIDPIPGSCCPSETTCMILP